MEDYFYTTSDQTSTQTNDYFLVDGVDDALSYINVRPGGIIPMATIIESPDGVKKFSVGDRVIVVDNGIDAFWDSGRPESIGRTGTILEITYDATRSIMRYGVSWAGAVVENTYEAKSLVLVSGVKEKKKPLKPLFNVPKTSINPLLKKRLNELKKIFNKKIIVTNVDTKIPNTVNIIVGADENSIQILNGGDPMVFNLMDKRLMSKIKNFALNKVNKLKRKLIPGKVCSFEDFEKGVSQLSESRYLFGNRKIIEDIAYKTRNIEEIKRIIKEQSKIYKARVESVKEYRLFFTNTNLEKYKTILSLLETNKKSLEYDVKAYFGAIRQRSKELINWNESLAELKKQEAEILKNKTKLWNTKKEYETLNKLVKEGAVESVVYDNGLKIVFPPIVLDIGPKKKCTDNKDSCSYCIKGNEEYTPRYKYYIGRVEVDFHDSRSCGKGSHCQGLMFKSLSYSKGNWVHPHVYSNPGCGGSCLNEYQNHFNSFISNGEVSNYVLLAKKFLESYNPHSRLNKINDYHWDHMIIEKNGVEQTPSEVIDGSL